MFVGSVTGVFWSVVIAAGLPDDRQHVGRHCH